MNFQQPVIVNTVPLLRKRVRKWQKADLKIGLIPTMGSLHDGHLTIVKQLQNHVDKTVVSIFVNPIQFSPGEDFSRYPRTLDSDANKLQTIGVDCIFAPNVTEMYGEDFTTNINIKGLSDILCGTSRQGHFDGVATVITKLLNQCLPDKVIFGEKDYQQLQVLKRLVLDLNIPVEIVDGTLVRDEFGLALSSRNVFLSNSEREIALNLNKVLFSLRKKALKGEDLRLLEAWGITELLRSGFRLVDYLEFRCSDTLDLATNLEKQSRILVAAHVGKTRLIDNIPI
ncbi:MAG: pantoate--beta-alanine ligase [Sphingomonadales bacterium]